MNNYEVVFIVRPDADENIVKGTIQKVSEIVGNLKGQIIKTEEWGKKRLAYAIKKHSEGNYIMVNMSSTPETCKEVERVLRLSEDVIRYQTVRKVEEKTTRKTKKKTTSAHKETNDERKPE